MALSLPFVIAGLVPAIPALRHGIEFIIGIRGTSPHITLRSIWPPHSHVLLDQPPDAIFQGMEARLPFHANRTRSLDVDRDALLDLAGASAEDHDAVGEIDRLVD